MPLEKQEAEKLIEVIRGLVKANEDKPARIDWKPGIEKMPDGPPLTRAKDVKSPAEYRAPDIEKGVAGNGYARQVGAEEVRTMIDLKDARALTFDEEALYQRFRARIIDDAQIDPVLLKLIAVQPEMIVEYERRVETLDGSSIRGRVAKLIAQGFMDEQRTTGAVRAELARTGSDVNSGGLSTSLGALLSQGFLVRAGDGWKKAPGIKISEKLLEVKA